MIEAALIVVLLFDDLRWDVLQNPYVDTPHMDRLAEEGIVYTNAEVETPWCAPSRATMLTGLTAKQHGVTSNGNMLDLSLPTFANDAQAAGYKTAWIGKWHLSQPNVVPPYWDYWAVFGDRMQGRHIDPVLNVDGEIVREKGHTTDVLTRYALEYMRRATEPTLLIVSYKVPHGPEHQAKYKPAIGFRIPESFEEGGVPGCERPRSKEWLLDMGESYYQMYVEADEAVGTVLGAVPDGAVVILLSDNGIMWGEHGCWNKGVDLPEAKRIPLIVWGRGSGVNDEPWVNTQFRELIAAAIREVPSD
jgi:N-acetylglucosamine-6-sulfatase